MTEAEAREALKTWRASRDSRDRLIRDAHQAGVAKAEIHELTGVARTTINRILGSKKEQR